VVYHPVVHPVVYPGESKSTHPSERSFSMNVSMKRLMPLALFFSMFASTAYASIDSTINNMTAPIAVWFGEVVFFKIPIFGAQLPVVVLWLIAGAVIFTVYMRFVN
jgi:AGCS family alanine or glycine:cation symporter